MIDRVTTLPIDHFPNVSRKYVRVKGSVDLEETAHASPILDSNASLLVFGVTSNCIVMERIWLLNVL